MYVWIIKFITFIGTMLSSLVYNFHKPIKGVKTKRNLKYKKNGSVFNKLDVHFSEDYGYLKNKNQETDSLKRQELKPCIVYFHGGGWTSYSKSIYSTLCRRLAKMGYVVFNVNYGLAPLNKMQNIMDDAVCAVKFVQKVAPSFGADSNKITLAGDSAGAHIASLLVGMIRSGDIDYPEIKGKIQSLVLLYGVYDIETAMYSGFPNIQTYLKSSLSFKAKNKDENKKYSPINYVGKDFPKVFMASGEIDKLHQSQSKAMAETLTQAGVDVKKKFFSKKELRAMHAYMIFDGLETNIETLSQIQKFLKGVYKN